MVSFNDKIVDLFSHSKKDKGIKLILSGHALLVRVSLSGVGSFYCTS